MATLFPASVYLLCFLTSAACALLLARSYRRTGARLLFWSALCFAALSVNNVLLVLDNLVFVEVNLVMARLAAALVAVLLLLFGLVWEED